MRYFDFIKEIKEISTSHILVNEYGEGDIYEYLNNGEHKYPCIFLTVTNLNTTDSGTAINLTLFYTDRLVENQANKTAIQSTGISVIKQILSRYEQLHPEYLLNSVNYTPFTEKFTDMCAGIFCDVVVENQIETLENYDNECEEGAFTVKTITLTKNGIYDIVGYDSAVVAVESDCHEYEELVNELQSVNDALEITIGDKNREIAQLEEENRKQFEQINSVTSISITENGTYTPPTDVLGYNEVVVDIPLAPITITQNGVYTPEAGGYNEVTVNISAGESKAKFKSFAVNNDCIVDGTWPAEVIDTSLLTTTYNMFSRITSLTHLDLSGWNTSKVTNMSWMFEKCSSLTQLDVSGFDTSNVVNMSYVFNGCTSLSQLDLTGWYATKVTNIASFSYGAVIINYVGGRTIDEVIANNITILNGLKVGGSYIMSNYSDRASLRALINGLADLTGSTSQTLTLDSIGSSLTAKLTQEDIAIATAKNWTIS